MAAASAASSRMSAGMALAAGAGRARGAGGGGAATRAALQSSGITLQRVRALSVADFRRFFVAPMLPVVLVGVAAEWPAIARWSDESYLQSVAGEAQVDVEVGRHFLDAHLEVQRSTLSCFMRQHLHVSASARKRTAEPHALQSRT